MERPQREDLQLREARREKEVTMRILMLVIVMTIVLALGILTGSSLDILSSSKDCMP